MNEHFSLTPSNSATAAGLTAESISRRAYDLWEQEGRPEGRDLEHWLRAEQQLIAEQRRTNPSTGTAAPQPNGNSSSDTQPMSATRTAAVPREAKPKRSTATPPAAVAKPAPATRTGARNGVRV